jgi:hypothetical protein
LIVSDEELWAAYQETPSSSKLAKVYAISERQIRSRLASIRDRMGSVSTADPDRAGKLEMLVSSIPLKGPGGARLREASVKLYGIGAKDELTQKIVREGLDSVGAVYHLDAADDHPKFPVIQPATPTILIFTDAPRILRKTYTVPIISDAQIGWLRDYDTNQLEPIHNPHAMDVAKQIIRDLQPKKMVCIGDWMDWTTFSRWQQFPEYDRVLQPSIETGYHELGAFKSAAGEGCSEFVMIGSNHQYRPEKFLLEYNKAALYVRRAGAPDEWPVFSEPFLLRYDELGITFSGMYPGGEYYILPDLVAMHAPPKSKEFGASVVHGHTHKLSRTPSVQHRHDGRHETFVWDTGCLCQTGSAENRRRLMLSKVPSDRARTDWTNGIAVVNVVDGKSPWYSVDQIHIRDGDRAEYRGQAYFSSLLAEDAA